MNWQALSHDSLQFVNYLPPDFTGVRVRNARIATAEGSFGDLAFQQINHPQYCFLYSILNIKEEFRLRAKAFSRGLFARIMLENHVEHAVKGALPLFIREGQFSVMHAHAPEAKLLYSKPGQYSSFDVFFSMELVNKQEDRLPSLLPFLSKLPLEQPGILVQPSRPADPLTEELIDGIMDDPMNPSKAETLLSSLLDQLEDKRLPRKIPSPEDLARIYAAEEIIAEDIRKHYLIPDLARRAKTNNCTLKTYFPYEFGLGPYGYYRRKRMRLAKRMLLQGVAIKAVAVELGFKSTADFTTSFRAFWHQKPSDFMPRM